MASVHDLTALSDPPHTHTHTLPMDSELGGWGGLPALKLEAFPFLFMCSGTSNLIENRNYIMKNQKKDIFPGKGY